MKSWDIKRTTYSVSDFLTWQKLGSLKLSPSFQRRSVWKKGAKSYLIDTILRGLPVPVIIMRDQLTNLETLQAEREIVDGQQRLRTILSFIDPACISDFNPAVDAFTISKAHNEELANKTFDQLDKDLKQRILDYEFSVHILPSKIGDREVLEIFARMNATGEKLNDQELRNAQYFGEFKTLMYSLASEQLDKWRSWKVFSEANISRMDEVETTSEFGILLMNGISSKNKSILNRFYKENDDDMPNKDVIQERIRKVFQQIKEQIGTDLAKSPFRKKPMFYALFASLYDIMYGIKSDLLNVKPTNLPKNIKANFDRLSKQFLESNIPQAVIDASTKATNNVKSRKDLSQYLTKQLKK